MLSTGRDRYTLGSLSHILDQEVPGYKDLPEFPEEAPDSSVRTVEVKRNFKMVMTSFGSC